MKVAVKANVLILLFLGLVAVSCRTSRPAAKQVPAPASVTSTAAEYILTYKDLAVSEMKRTGVPASITLAQGMLESDYGRSSLARYGNNHFGIKCHNDWTGQTITQHDDKRNECFRKYRRPEDSFYDHSDFLRSVTRYRALFDIDPTNYRAWAKGLKNAGYATNPDYANLLIRKIEENRLYEFDKDYSASLQKPAEKTPSKEVPVTSKAEAPPVNKATTVQEGTVTFGDVMARAPRVQENNRIQYIVVKDGETRKKLENEFQLLNWELARYNDLPEDFSPVTGQMLYIEPKREKADSGIEYHTVQEGDTMYMISQKYGIKLKRLYEMNRMAEGSEPAPGQKLWLQTVKPGN